MDKSRIKSDIIEKIAVNSTIKINNSEGDPVSMM